MPILFVLEKNLVEFRSFDGTVRTNRGKVFGALALSACSIVSIFGDFSYLLRAVRKEFSGFKLFTFQCLIISWTCANYLHGSICIFLTSFLRIYATVLEGISSEIGECMKPSVDCANRLRNCIHIYEWTEKLVGMFDGLYGFVILADLCMAGFVVTMCMYFIFQSLIVSDLELSWYYVVNVACYAVRVYGINNGATAVSNGLGKLSDSTAVFCSCRSKSDIDAAILDQV